MISDAAYYQSENATLYCGDCLVVMQGMAADSIDSIVTDPPYCSGGYLEAQKNTKAQGLRGATVAAEGFTWFTGDNMGTGGLIWLLRSMMIQVARVLHPNRSAFVFTDWRMVPHLAPALESCGMRWRNMIVWDKGNAGLGVGFKPAYEIILEFSKGTTEYQTKTGQNILRVPRVHSSQKSHQAEKPFVLLEQLILQSTPIGGIVMDCFMGGGSTGVACANTSRRFVGIEKSGAYCEIARRRIEHAQAQGRQLTLEGVQ